MNVKLKERCLRNQVISITPTYAYKYKFKQPAHIEQRENKMAILLASHQSTYAPEKHRNTCR